MAPEEAAWCWMWARPFYVVYNVTYCFMAACEDAGEEYMAVITNVKSDGLYISGSVGFGLPPETIMNALLSGTESNIVFISNTPLADGDLDPGEFVDLRDIFRSYDTCGADFEIGIPIGAMLAVPACAALGLPTGGAACAALTAFMSSFAVTISAESPSVTVYGNIGNLGDTPSIENDVNVFEYVYMAESRYKYVYGDCEYNVPVGMVIEFR
ncbi:hypothetical protein Hbut_1349 [Hyperthermus butylicus DSM 5456]|uniref:Uncharacterized protein n=1 Tax=Hyperthermus butylicus (strain DSM 5456 / JCM 9403 / PLM1-5) TaxID=415426 RepID=A2BMG6_HYPBU|nr:hypothetical protein Hbut_1349 [Hyperthermus butylicus DSM 5456]